MWVKLHPPFGDGRTWDEIDLPAPARVPDLLALLKKRYSTLEPLVKQTPYETFHRFLLIRNDRVLDCRDKIAPDDRLVIALPLTGG